jgi:beta-phosphoglucomutase-like phosphatase (HAD superfamily)
MLKRLIDGCEAVLFDFDGVVVDSEPCFYASYSRAFAKRGHTIDREEYWKYWTGKGEGVWGEIKRHGLPFGEDVVQEILAERRESYSEFCRNGDVGLIPGMVASITDLVRGGRPCAIASNSFEDDIVTVLRAGGVAEPPCPVIGRKKGLRTKPKPDIFIYAAGVLGAEPAGCLVVEDADKGLAAARAAGMACAIVRTPYNQQLDFPEADVVVESHEAFVADVRDWAGNA